MPYYPTTQNEWHKWIQMNLGFSRNEGYAQFKNNSFPKEKLRETWREVFDSSKGYSPDFVPALIRNIQGLLSWIYEDAPEPLWKGCDDN